MGIEQFEQEPDGSTPLTLPMGGGDNQGQNQ